LTEVSVVVLCGEHPIVGKQLPGRFRLSYLPKLYKRGLRYETVKEHYDVTRVRANINTVCSRVSTGWARRMDVSKREVEPPEKI
jgi:hypothetical protein